MDAKTLLALAINQAKNDSLKEYKGETTLLYFNGVSEYTVTCEKNKDTLLKVEPNLVLVAKFLNGEKID
jgi:hypothetical protein